LISDCKQVAFILTKNKAVSKKSPPKPSK